MVYGMQLQSQTIPQHAWIRSEQKAFRW